MSPTLFNLYFDEVRKWQSQLKTNYFIGDIPLNALLFVDDQIVLAHSEENLQRTVFSLNNVTKEHNLRISTKKTKVLGFKGVEHLKAKIEINNHILEQVTSFNYLGCNISYVRSEDPEIKLAKFLQLIGTIKRTLLKRVRKETVLKFYKTLAVPVLLHGAENWTLTVPQKKRIEAAKMKLLRPLAGYTLRDHKYNDDICSELGVQSIKEILDTCRSNWHDHLLKMEPYHVLLQVYHYRPACRKNVG
jgi:hypothetical protein